MLKETLERFDEKKFKIYDTYNNDFRCINDDPLSDDIKQFITEEIKLAFQAGKDSMREEILNKLPDKQDERKRDNIKGSWLDNPRIQRAVGFNSCLNQVKNIIKNV